MENGPVGLERARKKSPLEEPYERFKANGSLMVYLGGVTLTLDKATSTQIVRSSPVLEFMICSAGVAK